MIVSLSGNNPFAVRRRLDEIVSAFEAEHGGLALERIDAEEVDERTIIDAVSGLPFLSKRKMVTIRALSANKAAAEKIEQILSSVAETTDLILIELSTDKRTSFYKVLKSKTQLEEYDEPDSGTLVKWLVEQAKKSRAALSLPDANYLVERVGANQGLVANELEKLMLYDPRISRAHIDLLTEPAPQSKIFDLLDAAFGGDKKRALLYYDQQRAQEVEPQAIMAMIAWQLQLLALVKFSKGLSASVIAQDASLNPYPVTKAMSLAAKLDDHKLNDLVSGALDIDYKSKTSAINLDEALKTYVVTI